MITAKLEGWTFDQLTGFRDVTYGNESNEAAAKTVQALKSNMGESYYSTKMYFTHDGIVSTKEHCEIGMFVDELSTFMAAAQIKNAVVVRYDGAEQGGGNGFVVVNGYEDPRWLATPDAKHVAVIMNANTQITDTRLLLPVLVGVDYKHVEAQGELLVQCKSGMFACLRYRENGWFATLYESAWKYLKGEAVANSDAPYSTLRDAIIANR